MAAPYMHLRFFIDVSQGLLRTVPGLVRTWQEFSKIGEILGDLWNPWVSQPLRDLESLARIEGLPGVVLARTKVHWSVSTDASLVRKQPTKEILTRFDEFSIFASKKTKLQWKQFSVLSRIFFLRFRDFVEDILLSFKYLMNNKSEI